LFVEYSAALDGRRYRLLDEGLLGVTWVVPPDDGQHLVEPRLLRYSFFVKYFFFSE
jgi:hypothetical protein